jgi:hypothetical protein
MKQANLGRQTPQGTVHRGNPVHPTLRRRADIEVPLPC